MTVVSGSARIEVPRQARFFEGHFPGDPIVPGAKLLELILSHLAATGVIDAYPVEIGFTKFVAPVPPGMTLELAWQVGSGGLKFDCRCGEVLVANGALRVSSDR